MNIIGITISHMTNAHKLKSKVQIMRSTAYRSSTYASYTIGSGTTKQENQPAAQIAARHTISFLRWRYICHESCWC